MDVATHYDMLADENNDPFRDPPALRTHMDQWDGQVFLDLLNLDKTKKAMEIGVGTGRLAAKVAPYCLRLVGIDISPKTIERARQNLVNHANVTLICADFSTYVFSDAFDIVYSSLTMMHFEHKRSVIAKVESILNHNGIFCLSIDKNQSEYIDMGSRKLRVYPDTLENTIGIVEKATMNVVSITETETAYIILCRKQ